MYRMVIVDDNVRERNGMKTFVNMCGLDISICGVFANVQDALAYLEHNEVDIILSDVQMPVLSGLDLLREVKRLYPEIKFVFISNYDEFDYVKTAIDYEADGYLLKPVNAGELKETLKRVVTSYAEKQNFTKMREKTLLHIERALPDLQEQFFRRFLTLGIQDRDEFFQEIEFLRMQIEPDMFLRVLFLRIGKIYSGENNTNRDELLTLYEIKEIIHAASTEEIVFYPVVITEADLAVCMFFRDKLQDDETFLDVLLELKNTILEECAADVSIGVSRDDADFSRAGALYKQAKASLESQFLDSQNTVILFDELAEMESNLFDNTVNLEEMREDVARILTEENDGIREFIDKYFTLDGMNKDYMKSLFFTTATMLELEMIQYNKTLDLVVDKGVLWSKISNIDSILNLEQWLTNLFKGAIECIKSSLENKDSKIVQDIKELIKQNYKEKLTVDDIADCVHFSVNYANRLFKEEVGKSIFDYLSDYRMEKAKEMLKEPDSRIYLVALEVGYKNKSHFCMVFKKYTGLTPMEYKKKMDAVK